jgi:hypothetical protein
MKTRLKQEGAEPTTICSQLKMTAPSCFILRLKPHKTGKAPVPLSFRAPTRNPLAYLSFRKSIKVGKNRVIVPTREPMDSSLVTIRVGYGVSEQASPTLERI